MCSQEGCGVNGHHMATTCGARGIEPTGNAHQECNGRLNRGCQRHGIREQAVPDNQGVAETELAAQHGGAPRHTEHRRRHPDVVLSRVHG